MKIPHVNPVGILEVPQEECSPRQYATSLRLVAGLLLSLFFVSVVVTSSLSLGAYCLTSDGADTRELRALESSFKPSP